MKRIFFTSLLLVLVLTACAPASQPTAQPPLPSSMDASAVETSSADSAETATEPASAIGSSAPIQPAAQATSRGDKLEASDPASVKYGNGRPVLVEFFRFT